MKPIRKQRVKAMRLVFVLFIPLAMFVGHPWPEESPIDYTMDWLGYGFLLAGLGLRMWSTFYIGSRKSRELITEGPFSLCRNPLYIGTFMIVIGASLCFENLLMLILAVVVTFPLHFLVILSEENHLKEIFQDRYEDYYRRTPRFLFRWSNYHSSEIVSVSTKTIHRATVDALGVVLIPLLANFVDVLQTHNILPIIWRFP